MIFSGSCHFKNLSNSIKAADILYLFQAWSSIVYQLIPNVNQIETNLSNFAQIIDADEVLLFERATFLVRKPWEETEKHYDKTCQWFKLIEVIMHTHSMSDAFMCFQVISHCERKPHQDLHRFEKISNIIKQFKLSCSKLAASFQSMEVRNSFFAAFIDIFTSNTYVMVIMSDPTIRKYQILTKVKFIYGMIDKIDRFRLVQLSFQHQQPLSSILRMPENILRN